MALVGQTQRTMTEPPQPQTPKPSFVDRAGTRWQLIRENIEKTNIKTIQSFKTLFIFGLVGSIFLFGWLVKSRPLLKLSFVFFLLLIIAMFALEKYKED